mgnify:CR=1 FL=1
MISDKYRVENCGDNSAVFTSQCKKLLEYHHLFRM